LESQVCNVKHRNAQFSNECFKSIFGVFYMYIFLTSRVHQEDSLYMHFCMVCLSCINVSSLAGGRISSHSSTI